MKLVPPGALPGEAADTRAGDAGAEGTQRLLAASRRCGRRVAARGIVRAPALRGADDGSVQALGCLDLRQLIGLGERTGLTTGSGFQALRGDLGPVLEAAGVATQDPDHPTDTDAELFLQIP
ncbi:MAG: hypothetical protein QOK21_3189 [Solirubrobacteraceae bacterium]|nr:hypothetical protein [Solirubrobacteraceae bacterium]